MTLVVFYFYVYKIKKYAKKANYPNEPAHYFLTLFRKRPKAESNTFYICASGCDFSTIQSAVDAANSGDIIIVKSGIYTESIKINKKDLTIKSESGAKETIIQRRAPNNYIFKIDATNVKINGFTIKGEGSHIVIDCIFLGQSRNAIISKNEIRNCYNGISIGENSDNITISRNNFIDNGIAINFKGNSYLSPHNTIYLNNFKNNEIDAYAYYLARRPIDNIFISRQKITYQFKGKTFLNYLGNYWDKYKGEDRNEDGILDDFYHFTSSYSKSFTDENPLVEPFENYSLIFEPPSISFSVENYNTGKKYSSIQEAIDDPETLNSHTILVGPRTYWENINLYKPLNIKSTSPNPEDAIIRSAHNPWQIIYLGAENITLSGFTIEGTISLENVEFNHILGNIFSGSLGEIRFSQVTSTIVANNKILNCNLSGVFLNGSYNLIISNEIINCREGISSNQGDYNIITRNNFINNNRAICFDYPFHTTVYLNNFKSSKETDVYIYYLSGERDNIFNSRQEIHYFYGGKEFSNYLGNYWDKFNATDMDGDGIGDEAYRFSFPYSKPVIDNYPLIEPIENYPDFQFKSWFFSDVFEYEGGKGFTSGIATLTGNKLKVEGKVSFHGSLPNSISQIRLIATNGIKDEIASKEIPFLLLTSLS